MDPSGILPGGKPSRPRGGRWVPFELGASYHILFAKSTKFGTATLLHKLINLSLGPRNLWDRDNKFGTVIVLYGLKILDNLSQKHQI